MLPRPAASIFASLQPPPNLTLQHFLAHGFTLLEERPGEELVIGLVGRFWTLSGELESTDPDSFRYHPAPGKAQAAWNFIVRPLDFNRTLLATETRVRCGDPESARRFARYWRVISPFSGLMRRLMLRSVRRYAERSRNTSGKNN